MKATIINIDDLFLPKAFGIILKTKPKNFVMELNNDEEILMRFFNKKFDHRIDYNGQIFYLSEQQYNAVKNIGYDDLSLLGVTYRTQDLETRKKYSINKSLLLAKKLNISDTKIFLVTTNKDKEVIMEIANIISKYLNNPVEKIYLYDNYNDDTEIVRYDKEYLVLSLLLGKEIETNTITKNDISSYTSVDCICFDSDVDLFDVYQNLIGIDVNKIDEYIKHINYIN